MVPTSWPGWLACGVYAVLLTVLDLTLGGAAVMAHRTRTAGQAALWGLVGLTAAALIYAVLRSSLRRSDLVTMNLLWIVGLLVLVPLVQWVLTREALTVRPLVGMLVVVAGTVLVLWPAPDPPDTPDAAPPGPASPQPAGRTGSMLR